MDPRHLDNFFDFLRFRSVSTDPAFRSEVRACAEWLAAYLTARGLAASTVETAGHPVVFARNQHKPGRKTVLIYGHYDVQPTDPLALWLSDPFQPEVRDGYVFARGASDNKGQIFSHILGICETIEQEGDLPVNLLIVVEGEEEVGSAHFDSFLESKRSELACDIVAVSDTTMIAPGVPTLAYGLRGIAALEFTLRGPSHDLHSGCFGGAVANPATAAARIVASLHRADGTVAVPGFYDTVRPLAAWERDAWRALPFGDPELIENTGVPELVSEPGFSPIECIWARPTVEINGIGSGYQGEGSKTVIPSEARVKLTCRLVPDQDPATIFALVASHLRSVTPPSVTIEIREDHGAFPYCVDPSGPFGLAARNALREAFGKEAVLIREGGSIPLMTTFRERLGVETLLLGLALPDCNAHGPNESFPLENLEAGIRLNKSLLTAIAGA